MNKKLFLFLAFFITFISFIFYFSLNYIFFPDEIHIIAGNEEKFQFNIPIKATIVSNDNCTVSINNKEIDDNYDINLSKPFSIQSETEGNMDMHLSVLGIPLKSVTVSVLPDMEVVPCGITVGVRINTQGVMVLGLGDVHDETDTVCEPSKNILRVGDIILKADNTDIQNKEELIRIIEKSENKEIKLSVKRNDEIKDVFVTAVKSKYDNKNKIGVWVRDSTQGIGTVTYYNPQNNKFGALGHAIVDVDTKKIMNVKDGTIMKSEIVSIKKGEKGKPGELAGTINSDKIIGNIELNNKFGLYGKLQPQEINNIDKKTMPIALQNEIKEGPAKIRSNIDGDKVEEFDILIESINHYNTDNSKSMVIKITDDKLINKTNGIVQGMSGSPIIQNEKLIGAVTHVFVQEPTRGYGIFIENMLKQ